MSKIKVMIVEDHTIVRKGLCALLESEPGIEVVSEAEDGREALNRIDELLPEVVLMDISMPNLNGIEATKQIRKNHPNIKILVLSMHCTEEYIFNILENGASGYLLKKTAPEELVKAIYCVWKGESYLSPSITKKVIDKRFHDKGDKVYNNSNQMLTSRENEIIQLIAEGHTNKSIAGILFISPKTVDTHRSHIMQKLNMHNVADIVHYALQKGIVNS